MTASRHTQDYTSGQLLTGFLKKELIDLITPIILDIQQKRKAVTDDIVAEFMRPRKLAWRQGGKSKGEHNKKMLSEGQLASLDEYLELRSYLVGYEFSSVDEIVASTYHHAAAGATDKFPHFARWMHHVKVLLAEGHQQWKPEKAVVERLKEELGQFACQTAF